MTDNPVREKRYAFAREVIRLSHELVAAREFELSRQVLRAGTSIGANVEEALAAQSRRDFIAMMSIASKEARECRYWLRLLRDSHLAPAESVQPLLQANDALVRMLTSIVKTAQESRQK